MGWDISNILINLKKKIGLVEDQTSHLETVVGDNTAGLVKKVSDIETMLSPLTYDTSGLTYTNCSHATGGYVRIGNIVLVNIRVVTAVAESDQSATISGFPTYSGITTNTTLVPIIALNISNSTHIFGYLTPVGAIYIPSVGSEKNLMIFAAYVADTPSTRELIDPEEPKTKN